MVVAQLRALTAPITIGQCGRILGLDPDTIKARIHAGLFPARTLIIVGPDVRIDPALLADEIEKHHGAERQDMRVEWRAAGNGIDGYRDGIAIQTCADVRTPNQLVDMLRSYSRKTWVTKRDLVNIATVWAAAFGGGR